MICEFSAQTYGRGDENAPIPMDHWTFDEACGGAASGGSSWAKTSGLARRIDIERRTRVFMYLPLLAIDASYGEYHTSDKLHSGSGIQD